MITADLPLFTPPLSRPTDPETSRSAARDAKFNGTRLAQGTAGLCGKACATYADKPSRKRKPTTLEVVLKLTV